MRKFIIFSLSFLITWNIFADCVLRYNQKKFFKHETTAHEISWSVEKSISDTNYIKNEILPIIEDLYYSHNLQSPIILRPRAKGTTNER